MTINEAQNSIINDFSRLGDYLARYAYLTELGKSLVCKDSSIRDEKYALPGCQSQVWIRAQMNLENVVFTVDSDSLIIRGLLVLILKVLNNQRPEDILNADLYFFKAIGLNTTLSPSRANGVASIIKTMRQLTENFST